MPASVSVLALLLSVAVIVLQSNELATLHSSVQQAGALLPDYGAWQVGRIILVAAGLGCWLCPLIRRQGSRKPLRSLQAWRWLSWVNDRPRSVLWSA